MKTVFRKSVMLVLLVMMVVAFVVPGMSSAEIKFGLLPRLSPQEMMTMFGPLAEYLTKETGEKVSLVIPKDFEAYKAAVKAGQVDLGLSNPIVYVQLKKNTALELLALSAEPKAGAKFRGIIIARKDSGIEKVQDLKGKKLVFVDKDSAAGYIFQMLTLSKAGLNVEKDFTNLPFAKKHDNVVMAVFNKTADAGGIREDDLDKLKDKVDLTQIKIVAYTDYFPNWPVYATSKLDKGAAAKVKAALLKLTKGDATTEKVAGPAKIAWFESVTDKDYDMLRMAAQLVGAL
jgi:phosphonate transport system substrate-binding protein